MSTLNLTDDDFMDLYLKVLEANPPARSFVVTSLDFIILYANDTYLEFIGLKLEDVIGKKAKDINSFVADIAPKIRGLFDTALTQNRYVRSIIEVIKNKKTFYVDCYIKTIINPFTNNIIGFNFNVNWARTHNPLLSIIKALHKKTVVVNQVDTTTIVDLTPLEHEITVLLVIGKSYKETAAILSEIHNETFIPATISTITYRKIFSKFQVTTLSGLIEKATQLKILDSIPESFL